MDSINKQLALESANQELQMKLLEALAYKRAFEEMEKEISYNQAMHESIAWRTLPKMLKYIKRTNNIK